MDETRDLTPQDDRSPEELAAGGVSGQEAPREYMAPEDFPEFALEPDAPGPPPLDEADVRRWLERIGKLAAWVVGRFTSTPELLEPPAWQFTEVELGELTPPATRVLNRRLLWLAGVIRNADEIELAFLLLEYADHNLERVRAAREAEAAEELDHDLEGEPAHRGPEGFGLGGEE